MKKKVSSSKWLLVTAGLGSHDFESSAFRVGLGARYFSRISKVVVLDTRLTVELCQSVRDAYPEQFNERVRGFGFMAWKSEVVYKAIHGEFGDFDGVIWVDGGCEVFPSFFSELQLNKYLNYAERNGIYSFSLDTPEYQFTKSFLLEKYKHVVGVSESPQIQTTWIALHGELGRMIASEWLSRTLEDFRNLDLTESPGGEDPRFVENRYDQSIFSLICKEKGLKPASSFCVSGTHGFLSLLRASFYPIWASRNRTGNSIIPKFMFNLGIFTLKLRCFNFRVSS